MNTTDGETCLKTEVNGEVQESSLASSRAIARSHLIQATNIKQVIHTRTLNCGMLLVNFVMLEPVGIAVPDS